MTDTVQKHWQDVFITREPTEVSWYQREPSISLELIEASDVGNNDAIIDVGTGSSLLVDCLLERGYTNLTALDVSEAALQNSQERLGVSAAAVQWLVSDVRDFDADGRYALWHDRACFHFLVEEADRGKYVTVLRKHLLPGGHAIIATFALDGPPKCSGLPVQRYDETALLETLGAEFRPIDTRREKHITPAGREQAFVYFLLRNDQ